MNTNEIREKYLAFFESKGHTRCDSDVLVPTWDPSVLFSPAGMNQFKDHFLGKVKLDFTRATTSQKCLRTGDIDNVGRTAYHHTFFEMLGNFSFGDYFKEDAIQWAWEFLTSKQWLGLDQDRLTVTVYLDDDEAAGIWENKVGLAPSKITRMGEDDNFWPAGAPSGGPDGVCGPCSEIFYLDPKGEEVEIWNLVFTQFNRVGDPPDNLRPLPSKNIDTGMGLERIASVMQGQDTNYHIDILRPIVEAAGEVCGVNYDPNSDEGRRLRRIADHVRACVFAVHENVYPGPNKEKYVIRRLLRRAVLDGHQMNLRDPFLYQLVQPVVVQMQTAYPEISKSVDLVARLINKKKESFLGNIGDGLIRIDQMFASMESNGQQFVDGAAAADLYQTNGLPPELIEAMAAERNFTFDWDGFQNAMDQHGIDSGKNQFQLFKTGPIEALKRSVQSTDFLGYDVTDAVATIKGVVTIGDDAEDDQLVESTEAVAQQVVVVLDQTPFYGESGGQVGDWGRLHSESVEVEITDTQKDGELFLHHGKLISGTLASGETLTASVDQSRRNGIRRAHSATHILHHALQSELGSHAQQQGSKVDEDWLRFDFTNLEPVSDESLLSIEQDVNSRISDADPINWQVLPLAEAREAGAMMLFGEKYPDPVRMVSMGEFSRELCGGTHLSNTSEVEQLEITSEEGVAAGTRRVVALTGPRAAKQRADIDAAAAAAAQKLGVSETQLTESIEQLTSEIRDLKKQLSGAGATDVSSNRLDNNGEAGDYLARRTSLKAAARVLNVS
ncbi:MAG: alanine--tRNA ligase, partial [Pirellulales bacterium]|nr:alanine--tRNA ligase [Pirellulales bacterium]